MVVTVTGRPSSLQFSSDESKSEAAAKLRRPEKRETLTILEAVVLAHFDVMKEAGVKRVVV
jgi:hypothetical protein